MKVPTVLTFVAAACVIVVLAVLQANGFSLLGVKPNLALVGIAVLAFFIENILLYLFFVVLAGFILKFAPGFQPELLFFLSIGVLIGIIGRYFPWHALFSSLLTIVFGTLLFYLVFAVQLIGSMVFIKEVLLNMAVGTIVFAFFLNIWDNTENSRHYTK